MNSENRLTVMANRFQMSRRHHGLTQKEFGPRSAATTDGTYPSGPSAVSFLEIEAHTRRLLEEMGEQEARIGR